jgi:probable F420-dependent oxidoreductase
MEPGKFGVWTSYRSLGEENAGEAARLAEELGYWTFWLGGSPQLPVVRPLLEATTDLIVATGIVNVWQYEPAKLAAEYAELNDEFPDRLLLGIGIGHPEATSDYKRPLTTMRNFFDGLDSAERPVPKQNRCAAALGPKMLDLAAERSLGTHPYFVPPEHSRVARDRVGPNVLVAPEQAVVVTGEADQADAKVAARHYSKLYLGLTNYTSNLLNLGFTEEDIANDGSDALIDAVVPQGTADQLAPKIREHLDAGADHVCIQTVGVSGVPHAEWSALAAALLG